MRNTGYTVCSINVTSGVNYPYMLSKNKRIKFLAARERKIHSPQFILVINCIPLITVFVKSLWLPICHLISLLINVRNKEGISAYPMCISFEQCRVKFLRQYM